MQQHAFFSAATLLAATVFAGLAPAQVKPGHSINTVTVGTSTTGVAEVYDVDHEAQKATKLTMPAVLVNDRPNTVLMTSSVAGYFGTNQNTTGGTTASLMW